MNYFRVVTSVKDGSFTIGEDELPKLLESVGNQKPAIFRNGILLNPNMAASVVPDKELIEDIKEQTRMGIEYKESSPFAKLLADKMSVSPKLRTSAQEEAAKLERRAVEN